MSLYHTIINRHSLQSVIIANSLGCYLIRVKHEKKWTRGLSRDDWNWLKNEIEESFPVNAKTLYASLYQSLCFHLITFHSYLDNYEEYILDWLEYHDDAVFWCAFIDANMYNTHLPQHMKNHPLLLARLNTIFHLKHNFESYSSQWNIIGNMV